MIKNNELWDEYCAEVPAKRRSPQGAMAFAFDRLVSVPAPGASKKEQFCHWLKGYLGAIKGRDELDTREANVIRNNLNEMLGGARARHIDGRR